ncbi:MAG: acyl-CoA thioesterase [Planctomycetaceae bacterium]|jgi:acyl-CoA thioester hydrolase|nr:acyl-CoA thioesterase [Planctomycetaceae bacterium]MBT6157124.1 acyl-CoA thioesterase [Planctomycetaceae bacterium]MBT6483649.1 acyl-CoA thioesterase [Planctomycetaceae bacterium]MBT6497072.1 acyl-CoA thioesterase [Planctomycetaceae bacterium]
MIRRHETEIRVRYSETDAMGYLHHANYFNYFEVGRVEMLRAQGGDYRLMEERGLFLVVVDFRCNYRAPAHYDDLLILTTILAKVTPARLEHDYEVRRDGELLATAHSLLACVNAEGRVQRIPDVIPGVIEE